MKTSLLFFISLLLLSMGYARTSAPLADGASPAYLPAVNDYCGGDHFFDTGGADGNYASNEDITTTICPENDGDIVIATFLSFDTENSYDILFVYDANSADDAALLGSFTGTTIDEQFIATNETGCLTFVFHSDGSVTYPGWEAEIYCGPPPSCWPPSDIAVSAITHSSATLSWTDSLASSWDIELGTAGFTPTGTPTSAGVSNPFDWSDGSSFTSYDFYIRSNCGADGYSDWTGPYTFTTTPDFCAGDHFFDTGGADGNYASNEDITWTICPENEGDIVIADFISFDTEHNYDHLSVYNGNSVDMATLIGEFTGTTIDDQFIATNPSGCLTFFFHSDGSITHAGWEASIYCGPMPSCWYPSSPGATSITGTNATLFWVDTLASAWDIEIDTAGFTPTGTPDFTGVTNPFGWTGGTPETDYDFYVRANCGDGDYSDWVGPYTFTTLASCIPPTALTVTDLSLTDATLSWTDSVATDWDIAIGPAGFTVGDTATFENVSNPFNWTDGVASTAYEYYVRANCGDTDESEWAGPYSFSTLTDYCGQHFYDEGGADNNYPNNSDVTTIICPTEPGDIIIADFMDFSLESSFDSLHIYYGITANSANLIGGYSGTNSPGMLISLDSTGCLTFVFHSDGSFSYSGWDALITCTPFPTCWFPTDISIDEVGQNSATFSWVDTLASSWDIEIDTAGFTPTGTPTISDITNPYTWEGGTPFTNYDFYIRSHCGDDDYSTWVGPFSFTTLPDYCEGIHFFDTGGAEGNYQNGEDYTTVICPHDEGDIVYVDFLSFDLESGYDSLYIYDGDVADPAFLIGGYSGTTPPESLLLSTHESGCLTFVFHSDIVINHPGWEAAITCAPTPTCWFPSDITVTDITMTSALISWTDTLAGAWDVEIVPVGEDPTGTPTYTSVSNPFLWEDAETGTEYDVYVRANCGEEDVSFWIGPYAFTTLPDYCAGDHFYDTGGQFGQYSNNENITTTICPTNPLDTIQVVFELFNTRDDDTLSIYDADSPDAGYLLGEFWGSVSPGSFTATNDSGCLTFVFTSSTFSTASGWDAAINCLPFQPCKVPTDMSVTMLSDTSASLSWAQIGDGLSSWEIEYGVGDFPTGSGTIVTVDTNPFVLDNLIPDVEYSWYIRGICGDEEYTEWSEPVSFTTTITGIADLPKNFDLVRLYPNPTTGSTTIEVKNTSGSNLFVRLINVPGKIIFNQIIPKGVNRQVFDFSHLNKGIYFIQLTDGKGYITKRLLIH